MINVEYFVEQAKEYGFNFYTSVPCSLLTPLINYVIRDQDLQYVSASNEGDAVATAVGATLAGQHSIVMMQNSGLGNAVNPLTSLTWIFRFPVLLIVTLPGTLDLEDEPQHELMGPITTLILESMEIPWEEFPQENDELAPVLKCAFDYMNQEQRPYALIMRSDSVEPYTKTEESVRNRFNSTNVKVNYEDHLMQPTRMESLQRIISHCNSDDSIVITTTGNTGTELFALDDRPNHLYMMGSMGCAASLALGAALVSPDLKVIIIDGDGAALMRMGNFATIGAYGCDNLYHILLDNEVHDSTGGQATISANVSFAGIANSCGYGCAWESNTCDTISELFSADGILGPRFLQLKIKPGSLQDLPPISLSPEQVKKRLIQHISV